MATMITTSDTQPRELAALLDTMAQATLATDREMAHILTTARDALAALAWNRYAAHQSRQCDRRRFIRRHREARHA